MSRVSGPEEGLRRAGLIASQVLGLALGRYLLRLPGLADRPPEDLVADLAPTWRYLTAPLAPPARVTRRR